MLRTFTVLCLVVVGACAPKAITPPAGRLTVQTFTAASDGYGVGVSSHLVVGPTEALLVDGQLYRTDAQAVVDLIRAAGRKLTTVFLTHAHPDHYMGLDVIRAAFPEAAFVTTSGVLADYSANAPATFTGLKQNLGEQVADALVTLAPLTGRTLTVDGEVIGVWEQASPGESAHAAALTLDAESAVITGDLVYDAVHLYLGECTSAGWRSDLDSLAARGFVHLYPGHGAPGDASLVDATRGYLDDVVPILRGATGDSIDARVTAATTAIAGQYPTWRSSYLLGASTRQFYAACAQ